MKNSNRPLSIILPNSPGGDKMFEELKFGLLFLFLGTLALLISCGVPALILVLAAKSLGIGG